MFINELTQKNALIFIVDDTPKNIQLLGTILKEKDYQVIVARNGIEALGMLDNFTPDLILLDIMMPVMDGFEICQKIKGKTEYQDVPIIFLTAKTSTEDIVKGFELGAVDYITKPFNRIELLARVKTHLELKFSRDILKQMVAIDGLTHLYNYSYIVQRLEEEISKSKRHGYLLSLFMFDLDHFKLLNDVYGHKTGDEILVKIASSLKSSLRKEDIPARYGGEEFLIILPDTDLEGCLKVAGKVKTSIQNLRHKRKKLNITISGGICSLENENSLSLIQKAVDLVSKAKKRGNDRIEV
ncbi:MAG: diguanylate cyclase [Leptospiraceae bacterium]|nr:diguanylate cyclase [Leptospiraceae bacterium]MCP5493380.1 diguanylate cyclase [Leptospiraceae bacterium]